MTTEWSELLDRLLALQSIDSKIRRLDQVLTRAPGEVSQREAAMASIDEKIKKVADRTRLLRAQILLRENELKTHEKKIEKLQEQAAELKTNKEYIASRSEIANVRGECDRLQNEVLKILEVVEQADAKIKELEGDRKHESDRIDQLKAEMASKLEDVKKDRDALASTRPAAMEDIPKEQLELYERARKARGTAMAALEGAYCSGCGEPQTRNDMYAVQNRTRLVLCRGCNRILYQP